MIQTPMTAMLIRKARAGCRRSFGRLWNEHVDGLRAVVVRLLPPHLADDVVQDVAVAALSGISALREVNGECFEAWLRAIARNRARSALASQCRYRALAGGDAAVEHTVAGDAEVLDPLQNHELHEALRRLPRCYRLPLRLRYLRGFSAHEIATRLGMTHGSVRVSLCRGLRRLRECSGTERA